MTTYVYDGIPILETFAGQCQGCAGKVVRILTGSTALNSKRTWHQVDIVGHGYTPHRCPYEREKAA